MNNKFLSKIKKIELLLKFHDYLYYVLNKPKISDFEYDMMLEKFLYLKKKNKKKLKIFKNFSKKNSFLNNKKKNFFFNKHLSKMLSLKNTFSFSGIKKFFKKIFSKCKHDEIELCGELKYDGIAVNLIYKNRTLISAFTRGDGKKGENITKNIKFFSSIPKFLNNKNFPDLLEIRGEVYISKKNFKDLNKKKFFIQESKYSSARNLAAGSLRQKNYHVAFNRKLIFVCHGFKFYTKYLCFKKKSNYEILKKIRHLGFNISHFLTILPSYKNVISYFNFVNKKRLCLDFEIDGIVIKVNSLKLQNILGENNKFPRWALAIKFLNKKKISILKKVVFKVGRTGLITPVAFFNSINISGVHIKKSSLFNLNYIKKLDLRLNDTIIVERSGDVIPKITGVILKDRTKYSKKILFPDHCPSCGFFLKINKVKNFYCNNSFFCKAQKKKRILHFFSNRCFKINGFRKNIIIQLIKKKILNSPIDILKFKEKDFLTIKNISKNNIFLILSQINNFKKISLKKFIFSLGISGVGEEVSKKISSYCVTLKKFVFISENKKISLISGIGNEISNNIYLFLKNLKNKKIINSFKKFVY